MCDSVFIDLLNFRIFCCTFNKDYPAKGKKQKAGKILNKLRIKTNLFKDKGFRMIT